MPLSAILLFAQAPQLFKYQAVARDNAGNILSEQPNMKEVIVSKADEALYQSKENGRNTITFLPLF